MVQIKNLGKKINQSKLFIKNHFASRQNAKDRYEVKRIKYINKGYLWSYILLLHKIIFKLDQDIKIIYIKNQSESYSTNFTFFVIIGS